MHRSHKTLDLIYKKNPGLYNTALNVYGNPSYVTMDRDFLQVEQGAFKGCPLSNTFFNLGISLRLGKLSELQELRKVSFAGDGIVYRKPEIIMKVRKCGFQQ